MGPLDPLQCVSSSPHGIMRPHCASPHVRGEGSSSPGRNAVAAVRKGNFSVLALDVRHRLRPLGSQAGPPALLERRNVELMKFICQSASRSLHGVCGWEQRCITLGRASRRDRVSVRKPDEMLRNRNAHGETNSQLIVIVSILQLELCNPIEVYV